MTVATKPCVLLRSVFIFLLFSAVLYASEVTGVRGSCHYVRYGRTRKPLKKGMKLYAGDTILTGSRGRAELKLKDGTEVTIENHSRYILGEESRKSGETSKSFLIKGKADFSVTKLSKLLKKDKESLPAYKLYTPTAVAGVRGTEFSVYSDHNGRSSIGVEEGTVAVSGDPIHDSAVMADALEITKDESMTADINRKVKKEKTELPRRRHLRKNPPLKTPPDEHYVDYYTSIILDLGTIITNGYADFQSIMEQKKEAEAQRKTFLEQENKAEASELFKKIYKYGADAFIAKKKVLHRIIQFSGYLALIESADVANNDLQVIAIRVDELAGELDLKP